MSHQVQLPITARGAVAISIYSCSHNSWEAM